MSGATIAYVGLGGNIGDAAATLLEAFEALDALPHTRLLRASRLHRTPAWGRGGQPDFTNAVVKLETHLDARALLDALLDLEREFGRDRGLDAERWRPRILDRDLLLFGDARIDETGLRVPHPHLHERAFVLVPLFELAPDLRIPGRGTVREAFDDVAKDGIEALP